MDTSSSGGRVGIRDVARALGVSLMTVSLALRNSPRVSVKTREKVHKVAEQLGYRPDPEVARLMSRLRQVGGRKSKATIALVDFSMREPGTGDGYFNQVLLGAQERAEALGFQVMQAMLGEMKCGVPRLLHILYNRGVTGILLLPPRLPLVLPQQLDWSKFAVVSTTYAISPHLVNRVVPHQFIDMCRALRRLEGAGFKRIGIFFETDFEERTLYQFTAAITLLGRADWIYRTRSRHELPVNEVRDWIEARRPEIILAPFVEQLHPLLEKLPGAIRPRLYSLGVTNLEGIPCWEQRPRAIGAYGINLLVGMIHNSEFGLPESPATTMLHGFFRDEFETTVTDDGGMKFYFG
jgi:DNA-binding LacI/PurR family transcriptional regulator